MWSIYKNSYRIVIITQFRTSETFGLFSCKVYPFIGHYSLFVSKQVILAIVMVTTTLLSTVKGKCVATFIFSRYLKHHYAFNFCN